ncbi:MAG: hypothetical protein R3274_07375, partial [Desulfobacterales bacterium]|nr:hypothetical protein [Desulfobacterales bacterium]
FIVEASRWVRHRWELNESDFKRASTLCTLALVGLALYQFLTGWLPQSVMLNRYGVGWPLAGFKAYRP